MNRANYLCAMTLVLTACAPDLGVPGAYFFSKGAPSDYDETAFVDSISERPTLSEAQESLMETITDDPVQFLSRRPPTEVLNEAELVFFAAGRTGELLHLYSDAVDAGTETLRCRKAWLLERIGLHEEALVDARFAVRNSPEFAEAHFVLGFVLGQSDDADRDLLIEIRDAYRRSVTLDPGFVGPSDVGAPEVLEQVRAIDSAIR